MQRTRIMLTTLVLACCAFGCGNNQITDNASDTPTAAPASVSTPTAAATPSGQGATVLFSVDPMDAANPFPSDRLLDASGHVQVPASYLDPGLPPPPAFQTVHTYISTVVAQLHTLTGFATFAPLRIAFDRPVVVDTGENPRGIFLFEYHDLAAARPPITASIYDPDISIEVQPLVPLKAKTTYALVVTTALTDTAGNPVRPSPAFASVLAGVGLNPELASLRARWQPVIDFMHSAFSIGGDALALIDLFTTAPITDDLVAIEHRLGSGELVPGAPVFQNSPIANLPTGIFQKGSPEFQNVIGSAPSDNLAAVAVGTFDSYDFRGHPNAPFDPNLVNGPAVPPVNHLDFYMTIPTAPAPPHGYPLVIFGHGLGGSNLDVITVPKVLGDAPIMRIAISALQHGRRGVPTNFFVLNKVATTREYFRQTVADFMQLERMARNAHAAGTPPFDMVDTDHIMYFGVSLGGIMGTLYMAVEPDVTVGMLSVPGGGVLNIAESHDIGQLLESLLSLQVGIRSDSPFFPLFVHRFRQFGQWALEPADPIDYAAHIITPGAQLPGVPLKSILVHEGIIDNTVPNRTTDDLALAMRLPDLNLSEGCMDASGCSGIWRFVMTDYGQAETSGHGVTYNVPQASTQMAQFLASFGTQVIDVHP